MFFWIASRISAWRRSGTRTAKRPHTVRDGGRLFERRCVVANYDAGTRNARYGGVDITISASEYARLAFGQHRAVGAVFEQVLHFCIAVRAGQQRQ